MWYRKFWGRKRLRFWWNDWFVPFDFFKNETEYKMIKLMKIVHYKNLNQISIYELLKSLPNAFEILLSFIESFSIMLDSFDWQLEHTDKTSLFLIRCLHFLHGFLLAWSHILLNELCKFLSLSMLRTVIIVFSLFSLLKIISESGSHLN